MRRIAALLVGVTVSFACAPLMAGLTVKVGINFDGTVDTRYRSGEKPHDPPSSCPSGWTCSALGESTGEVSAVDSDTFVVTASGKDDVAGNYFFVHKSAETTTDLHLEMLVPSTWIGSVDTWAGCGLAVREGSSSTDYYFHVWWPSAGTARIKYDDDGAWPWTDIDGLPSQFLPRYLGLEYDDSGSLSGWESGDGSDWFQIGSDVSKTLTFPVDYGIFCQTQDAVATMTLELDAIVATTTLSFEDAGEPEPPVGSDHLISTSTGTVDCQSLGVGPGDTITLDGTSRGSVRIQNCTGAPNGYITVRNDATESGPLVVNSTSTNGFTFNCLNCQYVRITGAGKWSGASAGEVGVNTSTLAENRTLAGIQIRRSSNSPTYYMYIDGTSKFVEVDHIEIDGNGDPCNVAAGIGLGVNENSRAAGRLPAGVTQLDVMGDEGSQYWREGINIHHNYIHEVCGEGIYVGPNANSDGLENHWPMRNVTVEYNIIEDIGRYGDGIDYKSVIGGSESTNRIRYNRLYRVGLPNAPAASGNLGIAISVYEGGNVSVVGNRVAEHGSGSSAGHCFWHYMHRRPIDYGGFTSRWENNIGEDCAGNAFEIGRNGTSTAWPVPTIRYNTVVDAPRCVSVTSTVTQGGLVANNICADTTGISIGHGSVTQSNNRVGTEAAQNFVSSSDPHLTSTSPARNAATGSCPATDYDGDARPQEGTCDQGADEYAP